MAKSLFEELGGKYERQGDYLIPCLTVPAEEEQPIGTWGQRHLDYLKQYRKVTYTNLLTSGRLNTYLADIDRQAQERFERLIEGMKQAQGITEQHILPFGGQNMLLFLINDLYFYEIEY